MDRAGKGYARAAASLPQRAEQGRAEHGWAQNKETGGSVEAAGLGFQPSFRAQRTVAEQEPQPYEALTVCPGFQPRKKYSSEVGV